MANYIEYFTTPCGVLEVTADEHGVTSIFFVDQPSENRPSTLTNLACEQLDEYFKGQRTSFDMPVTLVGTDFQKRVWRALIGIPYGQVISYADLAEQIDNPKAVRAVGLANSKNPVSIVIPCHRVIGKNGQLTGYAGGLTRKAWLLQHEGVR